MLGPFPVVTSVPLVSLPNPLVCAPAIAATATIAAVLGAPGAVVDAWRDRRLMEQERVDRSGEEKRIVEEGERGRLGGMIGRGGGIIGGIGRSSGGRQPYLL